MPSIGKGKKKKKKKKETFGVGRKSNEPIEASLPSLPILRGCGQLIKRRS